ncbi:LrgB family protein, partial [Pseudomonas aeruginosa]|uniref:LrgB family protein n=1 Tax=Pseudomonas aeruginosa TaxID=287 RepID=UPI002E2199FC|nr:LrgB family protein [Pseudomonas aeruginosa]
MSLDKQALFWLAATVGGYLLSRQLYRRVKWYWLSPIVFVPVLLYALAIPTHTRYADYARDTNWLVALLGPATVAFAIPIWQQRELLMRHWPALLAGMFAGTAVAIGSSWALAQALALDGQVTLSLLPRSITTPFAMEMSHDLGGVPELTAAFVMITGVFGVDLGAALERML